MIYFSNELSHYGIRGMKWGVRKQMPSAGGMGRRQQMTPEERKAKTKKAIKVGAAVAGTALAAYGAYKVHNIRKENMAAVQDYLNNTTWNAYKQTYGARNGRPGYTVKSTREASVRNTLLGPQLKETVKDVYSGGRSEINTKNRYIGYKGSKAMVPSKDKADLAMQYARKNSKFMNNRVVYSVDRALDKRKHRGK